MLRIVLNFGVVSPPTVIFNEETTTGLFELKVLSIFAGPDWGSVRLQPITIISGCTFYVIADYQIIVLTSNNLGTYDRIG